MKPNPRHSWLLASFALIAILAGLWRFFVRHDPMLDAPRLILVSQAEADEHRVAVFRFEASPTRGFLIKGGKVVAPEASPRPAFEIHADPTATFVEPGASRLFSIRMPTTCSEWRVKFQVQVLAKGLETVPERLQDFARTRNRGALYDWNVFRPELWIESAVVRSNLNPGTTRR